MALPDFLIIGVMKGGTQAAVHNLSLHPDVWLVDVDAKRAVGDSIDFAEVHFFDDDTRWARGVAWYEAFFQRGQGHRFVGEKTPEYLSRLKGHPRMHETVPDARLIVLLREPVARAFSHWRQIVELRPGWDTLGLRDMSFAEAVEHVLTLAGTRKHPPDLLWRGCYADQIDHLLRWYPREQLLLCISERVRVRKDEEYARMFEFIGANPLINVPYADRHVRGADDDGGPDRESVDALDAFYAAHNARLFDHLGEVPPEWSAAAGSRQ